MAKGKVSTYTAAGLARLFGVSETSTHRWKDGGCPFDKSGKVSLPDWFKWYRQRKSDRVAKVDDADAELCKLRRVKRRREEIRLALERGRVIDRDAANRYWSGLCTDIRVLLCTIPPNVSLLVADADRAIVRAEAERIVRDALRTLAAGATPRNNDGDSDEN